jgi:REP element-mobilizing transposase RayT
MCLAAGTGEAIFRTDVDRKLFLDLLDQTSRRTGWQIHAYCLMDNHFHLVVETPRGNLGTGMQIITALGEDVAWDEAWELR